MPQKLEKYQPKIKQQKQPKPLKYLGMYKYALKHKGYWVSFAKDEDFGNGFFRPTASNKQLARAIEQGVRLCDRINKGADHTVSLRNVSQDGFEMVVRNRSKKKEAPVETAEIETAEIEVETADERSSLDNPESTFKRIFQGG